MKFKDLEYGNVLETRNQKRFIYHNYRDLCYNLCGEGLIDLEFYNPNFEDEGDNDYNIVKVYEDYTCQKVLWERLQLTNDEKALLRCLPKEIKYLARDEDGQLWCFETKPFKETEYGGYWDYKPNTNESYELSIFNHLFQFVKWENEEATSIEELLEIGD